MSNKKKIVVVLGAHRAGTSLVMQALCRQGLEIGAGAMPADEWNAEGYFELPEIYTAQDEILAVLDRQWESANGVLPLPDDWTTRPSVLAARERLVRIVRERLAQAAGPWGFKDPRTATLLPMWEGIFRELDVEPEYVLAVRHPDAVAESLERRNGFPEPQAHLLWMRTYLDALRQTSARPAAVVHYEDWFVEPERPYAALARMLDEIDGGGRVDRGSVQEVVQPGMRHHAPRSEPSDPDVAELYRLVREARFDEACSLASRVARRAEAWAEGDWGDRRHLLNRFDLAEVDERGESHGTPAAIWNVRLGVAHARCLMLQPPARARFEVAGGEAGELRFAVALHPDVWDRDGGGPCQFELEIDRRVRVMIAVDPHGLPADRRWHAFRVPVPHNADGRHEFALETKPIGERDHRWALWREPVFAVERAAAAVEREEPAFA